DRCCEQMNDESSVFVEEPFRLLTVNNTYKWIRLRITRAFAATEPKYLLTVQSVNRSAAEILSEKYK
ncbi:MAG: hypothetical protein J6W65_04530, partial [Oscillospiraceae bacterium]|nr:hypothetical protein [Oscillospiraceae bacterium]